MTTFDLHVHTRKYSSCSFINPEDIIGQAVAAKLDGLAITEHGMRWPDEEFAALQKQALPHGLVLINGQEIYTQNDRNQIEGDFLVFGLKRSLTGSYSAKELVDLVHTEGGIIIAAHPYKLSRGGKSHYYGAGDLVYKLKLDAIELFHPDQSDLAMNKVRKAMAELHIPGTGGSDAHKILNIGNYVTLFNNSIRNEDDFIREIRAGNLKAGKRNSL